MQSVEFADVRGFDRLTANCKDTDQHAFSGEFPGTVYYCTFGGSEQRPDDQCLLVSDIGEVARYEDVC
jgi:hypothetical protein